MDSATTRLRKLLLGPPWIYRVLEPNGEIEGIHPGGQGTIHLAIAVDRNDPNTVYVSGDRQDSPFPNFIGARDFSGRLFRGDTTVAPTGAVPSPQWEHLTHLNSIAQTPEAARRAAARRMRTRAR